MNMGVLFLDSFWSAGYNNEIDRCLKLYGNFQEGAVFIQAVFDALRDYYQEYPEKALPVNNLPLPVDEINDRMRSDQSLFFRPDIDSALFCDLLNLACQQVLITNTSLKTIVSDLKEKIEVFRATAGSKTSLESAQKFRETLLSETEIENDLLTFLFTIVLSSIYRRQLEPITEVLRTDLYEGGDCPLCGERPHYGLLKPIDGAKQLECWLCGTKWVHARVKCPYCNNEEREELGFFTIDGEDLCRVHYCQACCRYYKIVDARQFNADGEIILAIHNLASLEYDLLAMKEGFSPGSGLEWVNERELVEE
jgi:FdhE protein